MKNIILIIIGTLLPFIVLAQSEINTDVEIIQTKYAHNEIIPYGDEVEIVINLINHGPEHIVDNCWLKVNMGNSPIPSIWIDAIDVGDSVDFPMFYFTNHSLEDETFEVCAWLSFTDDIPDGFIRLVDTNQTNDTICFTISLKGENTNFIKEVNSLNYFTVYPNPIKGHQSLFLKHNEAQGAMPRYVRIINILGQEVYQSTLSTDKTIDLPTLAAGIYYLELRDDEGMLLHHQSVQIE